jgi:hypothetical protein
MERRLVQYIILILGMIYLLKNIIILLPGILLGIIITVKIQSQVYLWKKWFFSNKLAQFREFKRILIIFDKIKKKVLGFILSTVIISIYHCLVLIYNYLVICFCVFAVMDMCIYKQVLNDYLIIIDFIRNENKIFHSTSEIPLWVMSTTFVFPLIRFYLMQFINLIVSLLLTKGYIYEYAFILGY